MFWQNEVEIIDENEAIQKIFHPEHLKCYPENQLLMFLRKEVCICIVEKVRGKINGDSASNNATFQVVGDPTHINIWNIR
jgi:hypothetical protein